MTRTELALGSATFIAVAIVGWLSATSLDRHFAAAALDNSLASDDQNKVSTPSSPACVGADGSWKNWVWANVPMLSPKCPAEN
jgi:autotransporter translocation and assembly factor TamB